METPKNMQELMPYLDEQDHALLSIAARIVASMPYVLQREVRAGLQGVQSLILDTVAWHARERWLAKGN